MKQGRPLVHVKKEERKEKKLNKWISEVFPRVKRNQELRKREQNTQWFTGVNATEEADLNGGQMGKERCEDKTSIWIRATRRE